MKNIAYILFSVLLIFVTSCKDEETIYHTAARPGFAVGEQYEVGESVTFTDATVPNEGTKIVAYLWEFGDADKSTSTEQSPTFVFKKDGIYLVKLTVTDSNGLKVSSQKEITVINPTTPDFTFDKKKYVMGDLTTFTDATTTKSGTTITSYLWEFGDEAGTTSDKQNPTFTYTEAGAYAVKLTVTDSYGLTASITKSVTVLDPSQVIAVQWSSALNGVVKGVSSPALAKDGSAVYMLASAGNGAPATLNAFDVTNGAAKWTFDISVGLHDAEPNVLVKDVFSSPSVGKDGSVYIVVRDLQSASAKRHLYTLAVDANGAKKWHQAVGGNVNLYAITPAIDADGNIYVANRKNEVFKLTSSGAVTQLASTDCPDITGGISLAKDGTAYMFGKGNTGLYAYNTSGDNKKWLYNTDFGNASDALTGALRSASVTVGNDGTLYSVIDLSSGAGAVIALDPNGSLKWKYETVGAIPDGGVVLGEDGTVYANGGKASGSNGAGVVALGSDGSLKWHYKTESDAQTVPLIDNRGYIHFITADATYYILKPDGKLFSSQKIGDSTASSPVMDDKGNLYVSVKKDGADVMLCVTSEATSYNTNSAWPMSGQNPQRTGLQK